MGRSRSETQTDILTLLENVRCQGSNQSGLQQALVALATICSTSSESQDYFRLAGGVKELMSVLIGGSCSLPVVPAAFFCLACAVKQNVASQKMVLDKALLAVVHEVLSHTESSDKLLQSAAFVLACAVAGSGKGQVLAEETHCLQDLIHLLRKCINDTCADDNKWSAIVRAIGVCVNNPQNEHNQQISCSVLPHVLKFIQDYPTHKSVHHVLSLACLVIASNVANQERVRNCGGLETLINFIKKQTSVEMPPSCDSLVACAVSAVDACIADNDVCGKRAGELGLVPVILDLLEVRDFDLSQRQILILALAHVLETAKEQCVAVRQGRGYHLLVNCLTNTQDDELFKAIKYILTLCKNEAAIEETVNKNIDDDHRIDRVGDHTTNTEDFGHSIQYFSSIMNESLNDLSKQLNSIGNLSQTLELMQQSCKLPDRIADLIFKKSDENAKPQNDCHYGDALPGDENSYINSGERLPGSKSWRNGRTKCQKPSSRNCSTDPSSVSDNQAKYGNLSEQQNRWLRETSDAQPSNFTTDRLSDRETRPIWCSDDQIRNTCAESNAVRVNQSMTKCLSATGKAYDVNRALSPLMKNNELEKSAYQGRPFQNTAYQSKAYEDKAYQDRTYQDKPYHDSTYQDKIYRDRTCQDIAYQDRTYQDRTCQDRTCQDKAYQDRTYQDRTCQDKTYQDKVYQDKEYEDIICQDKGYQDKAYQDRTCQDIAYQDRAYRDIIHRSPLYYRDQMGLEVDEVVRNEYQISDSPRPGFCTDDGTSSQRCVSQRYDTGSLHADLRGENVHSFCDVDYDQTDQSGWGKRKQEMTSVRDQKMSHVNLGDFYHNNSSNNYSVSASYNKYHHVLYARPSDGPGCSPPYMSCPCFSSVRQETSWSSEFCQRDTSRQTSINTNHCKTGYAGSVQERPQKSPNKQHALTSSPKIANNFKGCLAKDERYKSNNPQANSDVYSHKASSEICIPDVEPVMHDNNYFNEPGKMTTQPPGPQENQPHFFAQFQKMMSSFIASFMSGQNIPLENRVCDKKSAAVPEIQLNNSTVMHGKSDATGVEMNAENSAMTTDQGSDQEKFNSTDISPNALRTFIAQSSSILSLCDNEDKDASRDMTDGDNSSCLVQPQMVSPIKSLQHKVSSTDNQINDATCQRTSPNWTETLTEGCQKNNCTVVMDQDKNSRKKSETLGNMSSFCAPSTSEANIRDKSHKLPANHSVKRMTPNIRYAPVRLSPDRSAKMCFSSLRHVQPCPQSSPTLSEFDSCLKKLAQRNSWNIPLQEPVCCVKDSTDGSTTSGIGSACCSEVQDMPNISNGPNENKTARTGKSKPTFKRPLKIPFYRMNASPPCTPHMESSIAKVHYKNTPATVGNSFRPVKYLKGEGTHMTTAAEFPKYSRDALCPGCGSGVHLNSRTYNITLETSTHTCTYHRSMRQQERELIHALTKKLRPNLADDAQAIQRQSSRLIPETCAEDKDIYNFSSDSDQVSLPQSGDESMTEAQRGADRKPFGEKQIDKETRRPRVAYTEQELVNLLEGVKKMGTRWQQILWTYDFHPSRTAVDLKDKYKRLMQISEQASPQKTSSAKPFSMCETRRLKRGVKKFGYNWKAILTGFRFLPGRTVDDLCRQWRQLNRVTSTQKGETTCRTD